MKTVFPLCLSEKFWRNKDFSASQAVVNTARALGGTFYAGPLPGLINVSETNQSVKEFDNQVWF